MLQTLAIFLVSSAGSVLGAAVNPHPWIPAGAGDVRSPCPALNALANHGFLPHNGRGMTVPILVQGLSEGLNVSPDFTIAIGSLGLTAGKRQLGAFDLDELQQHNFPIEHDASLSRQDTYFGSANPFNNATWQQYLAFFKDAEVVSISAASNGKYARVKDSQQRNPTFTYGPQQFVLSYGEVALYQSVLGNPLTGTPKTSYVRTFFEQERLPYEEGWTKSLIPTTLPSLVALVLQLNAANGEAIPEGVVLTTNTLKNAFSGLSVLTGLPIVGPVVGELLGA
ncbi:Chloroperoxidase [Protomyces lactucae-debilis]|uniref:Chloroperoxidase n=1 Tax=Protomyces lactucae-debilis TaxID=2754530 RepID=A0A1Y2F0K4_PROLT|nr:Chloroperoxidase [Protomyces lactucae-debilis]ORY77379.1 Chloroperoxidase [Protomyces lactucae-debilis]